MPSRTFLYSFAVLAGVLMLVALAACGRSGSLPPSAACTDGRTLNFAFYAFFEPVSFSADTDPGSPGFHEHAGYEADLLTALEAMDGAGLRFSRIPIAEWPGIWLLPSTPDFDVAGGGITILDSRTRDADGNHVVNFTSGHISFQQSLLVRAADAERYATHDGLTSESRVGAISDTTGEARLLQLTGLANPEGLLADGTRIVSGSGTLTADGTDAYLVTAAGSSANLEGRERLLPPSPSMPEVLYFKAEMEMIESLADGSIDAVARGAVGNTEVAYSYGGGGVLAVTALDPAVEHGGWTLPAAETALTACLNDKVDYLTNGGVIDYPEWRAKPDVFLERAHDWRP